MIKRQVEQIVTQQENATLSQKYVVDNQWQSSISNCFDESILKLKEEQLDLEYASNTAIVKEEIAMLEDEYEDYSEVNEGSLQESDLIEESLPIYNVSRLERNECSTSKDALDNVPSNIQYHLLRYREQIEKSENNTKQLEYDTLDEEQNSNVWDYFKKGEVTQKARCIYCKAEYIVIGYTTLLWQHLKEFHKEKIVEPKKADYLNSYYEFILSQNAAGGDSSYRTFSLIWKHFESMLYQKATCIFCPEIYFTSKEDTNDLWEHLINNHEIPVVLRILESRLQYIHTYYEFLTEMPYDECRPRSELISQHYRTTEGLQDAVCVHCGKRYTTRKTGTMWNHLLGHYKQKMGIKPVTKNKTTVEINNLVNNISKKIKSNSPKNKPTADKKQPSGKSFVYKHFKKLSKNTAKCNYCAGEFTSATYISSSTLKRHLMKTHRDLLYSALSDNKEPSGDTESRSDIKFETVLIVEDSVEDFDL